MHPQCNRVRCAHTTRWMRRFDSDGVIWIGRHDVDATMMSRDESSKNMWVTATSDDHRQRDVLWQEQNSANNTTGCEQVLTTNVRRIILSCTECDYQGRHISHWWPVTSCVDEMKTLYRNKCRASPCCSSRQREWSQTLTVLQTPSSTSKRANGWKEDLQQRCRNYWSNHTTSSIVKIAIKMTVEVGSLNDPLCWIPRCRRDAYLQESILHSLSLPLCVHKFAKREI